MSGTFKVFYTAAAAAATNNDYNNCTIFQQRMCCLSSSLQQPPLLSSSLIFQLFSSSLFVVLNIQLSFLSISQKPKESNKSIRDVNRGELIRVVKQFNKFYLINNLL